jgi:molybdopterin synthase sulfur carrier subunit
MRITLHTILGLKQVIGQRQLEIDLPDGATVNDLLSYMTKRWGGGLSPHLFEPESHILLPHLRIMVNGQTIQFLRGTETPLKDGDEVLLLPLVSGG